jgi:hypothetical protein
VCANKVAASLSQITLPYTPTWATMVSIKGPEIRTAMLRGNRPIQLVAGQDVTLVAVGEQYTTWEGFKDEATGAGRGTAGCCQVPQQWEALGGHKAFKAAKAVKGITSGVTTQADCLDALVMCFAMGQPQDDLMVTQQSAYCAGETRIGISYRGLCQAVHPGSTILLGNGAAKLQVTEITSDTELRAK